jgi:hypothetical protein
MAAQYGRTVNRFVRLVIGDASNVLREIPFDSINGVGLEYEQVDVTAFQDAVKNALAGTPSAGIEISGPFDTSAAVAASGSGVAPALSGSHTVLNPLAGDNLPHTLDVMFGIRHYWETGEPVFGLQRLSTSNSGYTCVAYEVNLNDGKYSAKFVPMGSIAPAFGTAAHTAGA